MLEKLQENAQGKSVQQAVLSAGEDIGKFRRTSSSFLESQFNAADLADNLRVLGAHASESCQTLLGFLEFALVAEPSRAFRDGEHCGDQDHGDQTRNCQRKTPLQRQVVLFVKTKVDPSLECVTETDETPVQDHMFSTVGRRRALRLPDRHGSGKHAHSPSQDEPANNELSEVEAGALKNLADQCENGCYKSSFPAAKDISDPGATQGTEECADGERGNDSTLYSRVVRLLSTLGIDSVNLWEMVVPVPKREKAPHTRLVVPKKDESGEHDEEELCKLERATLETHGETCFPARGIWCYSK